MAKVGIVTDTISCLPPEVIKEYDIHVVPTSLSIDDKPYRDQVEITTEEFWKLFPEMKRFSSGAPILGDLTETFTELGKTTDSIAYIAVSTGVSATYETAVQAKDIVKSEHPNLNIEVIDSKSGGGGQGFVVIEAARAAQAGKSMAEVLQVTEGMIPRVKMVMVMETLKYLIKGGRAPKTAYVGELLGIKPLIGLVSDTGAVEFLSKAMGKKKAMNKLIDLVKKHADTSKPLHIMAHYTNLIEEGEKVRDIITSQFKCEEVYLTPFTPIMSGHTGPIVALSFYA